MKDSELQSFLEENRAAGEFVDSGIFTVDFQAAVAKRATFALPRPGLWAVRTLQGLLRLGATRVDIRQTRKALSFSAPVASDESLCSQLPALFRSVHDSDPCYPLHNALLAALGRDYITELHWSEEGSRRQAMLLSLKESSLQELPEPISGPVIEVHVRPQTGGLLSRLFAVADFSPEFHELGRAAFLSPVPVTLDSRPCDLASGFTSRFYPSLEFRGVRATKGPRLMLEPTLAAQVKRARPRLESAYQPFEGDGYAFLLSIGWNSRRPQRSTAAWVRDGVLVDEEPLFSDTSPLVVTLFLPADGLPTDATGMALRQSRERTFRLREARLWAMTSLKTDPPPTPFAELSTSSDEAARQLEKAIETRMKQTLVSCNYTGAQVRTFENAITSHIKTTRRVKAVGYGLAGKGAYLVKEALSAEEEQQRDSLNRWGSFLSYTPPQDENIYVRFQEREAHKPPPPPKFFGEVYVTLAPEPKRS